MQTVSFGELQDARLVLEFPVTGAGPLRSFMGDSFTPDMIRLTYGVDSIGEASWYLDEVQVSGPNEEVLPGRFEPDRSTVGSPWRDAIARLPAWAWRFAAKVDPSKELGYADD